MLNVVDNILSLEKVSVTWCHDPSSKLIKGVSTLSFTVPDSFT